MSGLLTDCTVSRRPTIGGALEKRTFAAMPGPPCRCPRAALTDFAQAIVESATTQPDIERVATGPFTHSNTIPATQS
jgi:hypothetical protein